MVLAWSRLLYVESIRRAGVATFLPPQRHVFEAFGGLPRHCLYDDTKVVVPGAPTCGATGPSASGRSIASRASSRACSRCEPFRRTLDQFDFRFQPSIDKRQVRDLATLTFVTEAANVTLLGPRWGVGKTHLAVAL